jgi:hypothetical protein
MPNGLSGATGIHYIGGPIDNDGRWAIIASQRVR